MKKLLKNQVMSEIEIEEYLYLDELMNYKPEQSDMKMIQILNLLDNS